MSFFSDIFTGVSKTFLAPVNLVRDIASGQNVLKSIELRTLQGAGGFTGIGGDMLLSTKPAQSALKSLSPVTFGLSGNIAESVRTGNMASTEGGVFDKSGDSQVSQGQLTQVYRTAAEIGAAVVGATALAPAGGYTATQVGLTATTSKFLSGQGSLGDVFSAAGGADLIPSEIGDIGSNIYGPREAPGQEIGAANFIPRVQLKTPTASVNVAGGNGDNNLGPILAIALVGVGAILLMRR